MGKRRRARESALQMLFQIDLSGSSPAEVIERFWQGREVPEDQRAFAERLVVGVHEQRREMDRLPIIQKQHEAIATHLAGRELTEDRRKVVEAQMAAWKAAGGEPQKSPLYGLLNAEPAKAPEADQTAAVGGKEDDKAKAESARAARSKKG